MLKRSAYAAQGRAVFFPTIKKVEIVSSHLCNLLHCYQVTALVTASTFGEKFDDRLLHKGLDGYAAQGRARLQFPGTEFSFAGVDRGVLVTQSRPTPGPLVLSVRFAFPPLFLSNTGIWNPVPRLAYALDRHLSGGGYRRLHGCRGALLRRSLYILVQRTALVLR